MSYLFFLFILIVARTFGKLMYIEYEADLSLVFDSIIIYCLPYSYTLAAVTPTAEVFVYEYIFYSTGRFNYCTPSKGAALIHIVGAGSGDKCNGFSFLPAIYYGR